MLRTGQFATGSGGQDISVSDVAQHAASENEVDLSNQKLQVKYIKD